MKLCFYRHLPTNNNLNSVFLGRLDLDCNYAYMNKHLVQINETFENKTFNHVFCSPLKRARQSAEVFFPSSHYIIDRRLIERDLGDWKNVSKSKVKLDYPDAFYANGNLNFDYTPPRGESFREVLFRVSSFVLDLHDNYSEDESIAIVTHNGIITAMRCLLQGTTSTENIKPYPYIKEYDIEITPAILENLDRCYLGGGDIS